MTRCQLDPRNRQVARERQITGQSRQRLNLRWHDHALTLDAQGSAATAAAIIRRFTHGVPFDLMLTQTLAQVFSGFAVGPAAAEHQDVAEATAQYRRILLAVGAVQLGSGLNSGDDAKAVLAPLCRRVF